MKLLHICLLIVICMVIVQPVQPWRFLRRVTRFFRNLNICYGRICVSYKRDAGVSQFPKSCFSSEQNSSTDWTTPMRELSDPFMIYNKNTSFNYRHLRGNILIRNATYTGLPNIQLQSQYYLEPSNSTENEQDLIVNVNITGNGRFYGDFQVLRNGFANLSTFGEHTYAGKGVFNMSLTQFSAQLRTSVSIANETVTLLPTGYNLQLNTFKGGITMEGLTVDEQVANPVNIADENLKPILEGVLSQDEQISFSLLNDLLTSCLPRSQQ